MENTLTLNTLTCMTDSQPWIHIGISWGVLINTKDLVPSEMSGVVLESN